MAIYNLYIKNLTYEERLKREYFVILLFIISPLLSLPLIFIEIYNKKRYAQSLLALFMALSAWLFPPILDLYRHYLTFLNINDNPYYLNSIIEDKFDVVLYGTNKIVGYFGFPFELVRFLFVWVAYEIVFWLFRDFINRNKNLTKHYFIIFLIFFFTLHYFNLTTGLRSVLSANFFILGIYLYYYHKKMGLIYMFLGCLTHYSLYIYLIPVIFIIKSNLKFNNKTIIIFVSLSLLLLNPIVLEKLVNLPFLPKEVSRTLYIYLFGRFSGTQTDAHNFNFFILYITNQLLTWILAIITFFQPNKNFGKMARVFIVILVFMGQVSFILYERFALIFVYIALFAFFSNFKQKKYNYFYIILAAAILARSGQIYSLRNEVIISYENRLIMPVPAIFATTYSSEWVFSHLDTGGFLR